MFLRISRFLLLTAFLLVLQQNAFAQYTMWGMDDSDIAVRQGAHIGFYGASAQDDDGNTCVLWSDARDGIRGLFVQKYNSEGEPQWGEDGFPIFTGTGHDFYHQIISLSDGSWIAVSLESIEYAEYSRGRLYAQRLDPTGEFMWDDNGVLVSNSNHATNAVEILPSYDGDTLDGVIFAWIDHRSGEYDIYAQKFSLTGDTQGDPLWEEDGVLCAYDISGHYRMPFSTISSSDGGLYLTWTKRRDQVSSIQMQKLDENGNLMWADGDEDPSCEGMTIEITAESYSVMPQLVADGTGGAFIVWKDTISETSFDAIIAQHVDAESNFLWENHEIVCDYDSWKDSFRMVGTGDGAVVAWTDSRNPGSELDLYMQKFIDVNGSITLQWGELDAITDGIQLCGGNINQDNVALYSCGDGGFVACWTEFEVDYAMNSPLTAQRFTSNGVPMWDCGDDYGLLIGRAYRSRYWSSPRWDDIYRIFCTDSDVTLVWQDLDLNDVGIWVQKIDNSGEFQLPQHGVSAYQGIDNTVGNVQMVVDNYWVYVGWEDYRGQSSYYCTPYLQKLNAYNGQAQFDDNGISLMPAYPMITDEDTVYASISDLSFIADEMGGVIATWQQRIMGGSRSINCYFAQHVNSTGTTTWDDAGTPATYAEGMPDDNHRYMHMVADGEGGAYFAFNTVNSYNTYRIGFQHMNSSGECQLSDGSYPYMILLANGTNNYVRDLASFNTDYLMVLFQSTGNRLASLFLDGDGNLNPDEPVYISDVGAYTSYSQTMLLTDGMLVVWQEAVGSDYSIRGQVFSENGDRLWDDEYGQLLASCDDGYSDAFDIACYEENLDEFWLAWITGGQLFAQRYSAGGEVQLDEEEGVLVYESDEGLYLCNPTLTAGRESDAFISWEEGYYPHNERKYTHIDAFGEPFTTYTHEDSLLLADSLHYAREMVMEPFYNGEYSGFIAVWTDDRSWNGREYEFVSNVYAQCIMDQHTGASEYVQAPTPSEYVLHSAYPNPFNPSTIIAVGLPNSAELTVKVYNVMGREVATLANGRYQEGFHAFQFDASGLASGLYFVQATVPGEMHEVQKIMLVK